MTYAEVGDKRVAKVDADNLKQNTTKITFIVYVHFELKL